MASTAVGAGPGDDGTALVQGIRTIPVSSWRDFSEQAAILSGKRSYVWRGQEKDEGSNYHLRSTFDRKVPTTRRRDRDRKLAAHLDNFVQAMRRLHPSVPQLDADSLWALGRHYRLLAPLLDWTQSPYIAAYFAFMRGPEQDDEADPHRYVYALDRDIKTEVSKEKVGGRVVFRDKSVLFIDKLPYYNPRFTAQRSVFTKSFMGNDIERYAARYARRHGAAALVKFELPVDAQKDCLKDLALMNIDHTSLLLDYQAAIDTCNNQLSRPRSGRRAG
jgi:hypothetical protein